MADFIPFNKPYLAGGELHYIRQSIDGRHTAGGGPFTARCEALLRDSLGCSAALLTTSCTHALEMAALLLDLGPGDEVIVPSFTFVSTANAFALRGARPVFADVDETTLNLDPESVARRLNEKTKAVVIVHYAGVAGDMPALGKLLHDRPVTLIEDNAHGLYGTCGGKYLGTFGRFATLSFHETKNFSCGEGGALLLNDPADLARAEIFRDKGTNRKNYLSGLVDKYTWVDLGSSYSPSDLLAAFLLAQLENRETIRHLREKLWNRYRTALADWAAANGVRLPAGSGANDSTHHLFHLILDSEPTRNRLMDHLRRRNILAVFHYQPLHLSAMGRRFGGRPGDCPNTEEISGRLLRLPLYNGMSEREQETVIQAVREFSA